MNSFTNLRDSMSGISGKMDQLRRRFSQTEMNDESYDSSVQTSTSPSPNRPGPSMASPGPGGMPSSQYSTSAGPPYAATQSAAQTMRDRPNMNLNLNSASPISSASGAQGPNANPAPSSSSAPMQQQRPLPKTISAPTSPTKTFAPASAANIARSIFRQVSQSTTNLVKETVAGVSGRDFKGKVLLVIDDQNTDWSKYFRGRRIQGEWEVRVEQAEFSEISAVAFSDRGTFIDVEATRAGSKVIRSFRPDFVLIRKPIRDGNRDHVGTFLSFMYSNVPSVNSLESLYAFLDKPAVFSQLQKIQDRLGRDKFPLIPQAFYPNHESMLTSQVFPAVVKVGHCHGGLGKMVVETPSNLADVASLAGTVNAYSTIEPFIDSKYDLHLQKIGPSYKAFIRKSITGSWKGNTGSSMLEQIPLQEKHRGWLEECSRLCGGLDIFAIEVLVGKDGQEYIIGLNDSTTMSLLGEAQEEDRQMIAEIVFRRMDSDANRRRFSQTQTLPPPSQQQQQQQEMRQPGSGASLNQNVPNGYPGGGAPLRRESREGVGSAVHNRPDQSTPPTYGPRPGMPDRPGGSGAPIVNSSFGRDTSRDPPLRDPRDSNIREYSSVSRDMGPRDSGPMRDTPPMSGGPPMRRENSDIRQGPPVLEKRQSQSSMQVGANGGVPTRMNPGNLSMQPPQQGPGPMPNRPLNASGEVDDTMSNLKKTFAGIFGDM